MPTDRALTQCAVTATLKPLRDSACRPSETTRTSAYRLKSSPVRSQKLLHLRFCHFDQSSLGSPARQHGARSSTLYAAASRPGETRGTQLSRPDARTEINVSKGNESVTSRQVGLGGAPQRRRSPVGEGPTQGGCWLNLIACERPNRETGQGEASR